MGSFQGHALPGTCFLLFGLWFAVKCPLKYLSRHMKTSISTNLQFQRLELFEGMVKAFFGVLFCLFYFHVLRSALDQHIHFLLLISIFSVAACCLLEVFIGNHPALELFATSMIITQGSWFWQIGFVLYPPWQGPGWDQTDHDNIMFITMCFFCHYAVALLIIAFNYAIIYCCLKRWTRNLGGTENEKLKLNTCFYTVLLNGSDEE